MHRVLVVGEALVDVVDRDGARSEHVGGSPANVAMGLARLGHPTVLAACVGDDERGDVVVEHVTGHGVELSHGTVRPGRTSTAQALLAPDGSATYTFEIEWDPTLDGLGEAGHVHTGSLATVLEPGAVDVVALVRERREAASISYDPNIRPAVVGEGDHRIGVEEVIALSDVVKGSDEDVRELYGDVDLDDVMTRWLGLGAGLVVITRGADGVVWRAASGASGSAPARAPEVADTVGAGDSFMAGLLSGLLDAGLLGPATREALHAADEAALAPALDRALTTSAITVGRPGAYAPARSEL